MEMQIDGRRTGKANLLVYDIVQGSVPGRDANFLEELIGGRLIEGTGVVRCERSDDCDDCRRIGTREFRGKAGSITSIDLIPPYPCYVLEIQEEAGAKVLLLRQLRLESLPVIKAVAAD